MRTRQCGKQNGCVLVEAVDVEVVALLDDDDDDDADAEDAFALITGRGLGVMEPVRLRIPLELLVDAVVTGAMLS